MDLTLKIWRQAGPKAIGAIETYDVPGISEDLARATQRDAVYDQVMSRGWSKEL